MPLLLLIILSASRGSIKFRSSIRSNQSTAAVFATKIKHNLFDQSITSTIATSQLTTFYKVPDQT